MKIKRVTAENLALQLARGMEAEGDIVKSIGTVSGDEYLFAFHMGRKDGTEYVIKIFPNKEMSI